ncbi:MAG: MBL fold metallo-hydrolase, partial [bacterium]|nr:MBL fold metallo-hydrolase [bacterium]
FVGHQAAGTPGRAIQDAASNRQPDESATVYLGGQQVSVNAEVQTLHGISAHADRNELGAWLDAIPNVKRVALHHGEEKSQKAFSKWYERQK